MRSWMRENAVACCGAALGIAFVAWLGLTSWEWTDYDSEARPAIDALLAGHISGFLTLAPAYGGSLLMRAPFMVVPKLWGGGELSIFRAAAAPCLVASAILGVWLVARMRALGRSTVARALALALCVANPLTLRALEYGHPEELLGAVLCVAAVLVAMRGRPLWAGALLGLAIANKQWALVAAGPVLLALPGGRLKALLMTGGVAAVLLAPFALAGSGGSLVHSGETPTGHIFNPWQLWWFLGSHAHPVRDIAGHIRPGYRIPPGWISGVAHPLIVGIAWAVALLYAWLRRGRAAAPNDALLLLALVLLLRFALDPWDISYYALPFLIALLAWEVQARDRPPMLALLATFAAWLTLQELPAHGFSPDAQALAFAVFTVPALVAMTLALFAPGFTSRLGVRMRRRAVVPSAA
jgi:Glycosyltransferase family 87